MKNGFYERIESELQGKRNTYYVGGLTAFELTERNSSYAMALVCKHFANNNSPPVLPYVKVIYIITCLRRSIFYCEIYVPNCLLKIKDPNQNLTYNVIFAEFISIKIRLWE